MATSVWLCCMYLYLEEQGILLTATPTDIDRTFRAVAASQMTEDYFAIWLDAHTERS